MSYTYTFPIALGPVYAGLTLAAQLVDTAGANVGSAVTTGFVEVGTNGDYLWTASVPDAHRGGVKVYESGVPGTVLAVGAINPEDAELVAAILEDTGTEIPALVSGLSGATVTVVSSVDGGTITLRVGDTWRFTVSDATLDLSDYETVALVVKRSAGQPDDAALLYLRSDTGLVRIGGAAPAAAENGTLSKTATTFTGMVALAETSGLQPGQYVWWLKGFDTTPDPDEALTLATGAFVLLPAGLAAVV